jgi:hypothetical protein
MWDASHHNARDTVADGNSRRVVGRNHVIRAHKTRLRRTHISRTENLSVILVLAALIALVAWVTTTRRDFDPRERDLPIELLNDTAEITLYNRPVKPWVEPGQPLTGATLDLGSFPARTLDAEWQPVGRLRRFGADNLYEKINGEAEKFIKQGFVELSYLLLRSTRDSGEIALELFDQGDLGGSLGIFAEHASGRKIEERDGVSFFTTSAGVIGRKDRFFFRVAGDREGPAITAKAVSLVSVFSELGGTATTTAQTQTLPAGFVLLRERLGLAEANIQYQASNVFQYDFARDFWFGDPGLGDNARVFVHVADDPAAAQELIAALLNELSYDYEEVGSAGALTYFRHRFLATYFVLARRGRYVYGAERLPAADALASFLERISEAVSDEAT